MENFNPVTMGGTHDVYYHKCQELQKINDELVEALKDIEGLLWGSPTQKEVKNAFYRSSEALAHARGEEVER